jgi:hypothetical protein
VFFILIDLLSSILILIKTVGKESIFSKNFKDLLESKYQFDDGRLYFPAVL